MARMSKAAIYARISRDSEGEGKGVARQQEDCIKLCEREGWEVVEVYVDNDASAYSGKPRPGYLKMMGDLADGKVNTIVAWHNDRLHRSVRELEDFIDAVHDAGAEVRTVQGGTYDLSTTNGRTVARLLGVVAKGESEQKSDRQKRKHEQTAREGGNSGGGRRPFGYASDAMTLVPEEADLIRDAVEQVLAGATLRSIGIAWKESGVLPPGGASYWSSATLRRLLMSPRIAGMREHKGEVVAKAKWPAIITESQHRRVRAVLTDPSRRRRAAAMPRTYLLTGFVHCGVCGARMYGRSTQRVKARYECKKDKGGCDTVGISAGKLEPYVMRQVWELMNLEASRDAVISTGDDEAKSAERDSLLLKLSDLDARRSELASSFADGALSLADYQAASAAVQQRQEDAGRALAALEGPSSEPLAIAKRALELRDQWDGLDLGRKQEFLATVVERVSIAHVDATYGNKPIDPRVSISWRF